MRLSNRQITAFQKKIFSWWKVHKRDLPWRRTRDPYRIMVSEVMLQQTQVSRVLPKYTEFLEAFPTAAELAHASPARVLRVWKGMGYNRRALYLHKAAKIIIERHNSQFPVSEQLLSKLPGLGTYTARAILVFAYGQEVPLVDTNIRQIITHFFFKGQPQKESGIRDAAKQLLPRGKSWEWHQALMDYNAIAMSKLKGQNSKVRKNNVPFRESRRFYRGRIIDRLREAVAAEQSLIDEFARQHDKPASFLRSVIASLVADGLIERASGGSLRLPGE